MSTFAFYAPMKSPTHPTPSGDRAVARGVLAALNALDPNYDAQLVSDVRLYDGKGDASTQAALISVAEKEAARLIKLGRNQNWQLWFTYHNYYKAPDLIGPIVSKALNIPYVLLEATRAKKRLSGPWADFAKRAEAASDHAGVIFYFTQRDYQSLDDYRFKDQKTIHLPPFLSADCSTISAPRRKPKTNTLLSVGMLRHGAKAQSYALIAKTLTALKTSDWHLKIAGGGAAKAEIEALFEPIKDQISFLGQLTKSELAEQYAAASVFLWPGVDEAFGMVYLEAQAAGLPVVAQDRPGVRDVIAPSTKLAPLNAPDDMAHTIDLLFNDADHWCNRSQAGITFVEQSHLFGVATKNLATHLIPLLGSRT